jgi:hypothetical protein
MLKGIYHPRVQYRKRPNALSSKARRLNKQRADRTHNRPIATVQPRATQTAGRTAARSRRLQPWRPCRQWAERHDGQRLQGRNQRVGTNGQPAPGEAGQPSMSEAN